MQANEDGSVIDERPIVSVVKCKTYELDAIRRSVKHVLAPLGGMARFVRPGDRVLLKPNLVSAPPLERAVTTHPAVVRAVAELAQGAGGVVQIGDSPAGSSETAQRVLRRSGMMNVAAQTGAQVVPFDGVEWRQVNGTGYHVARVVLEADLVINLPKLKTHTLTLYTGAVKNMFGAIVGARKRELHVYAPGVHDFSRVLVDVLSLTTPGLTIMDGIMGLEGSGPGAGGTPRHYDCLAASTDPVALDGVMTRAMGYRDGEVLHLAQAARRGLGAIDPEAIDVEAEAGVLDFGPVDLPTPHWYLRAPAWISAPLRGMIKLYPDLQIDDCVGCGQCAEACPREAIAQGKPVSFDLERCVGCMCCTEVCPEGAIAPGRNLLARLIGLGG
jgi:uncharacterized protein (DUF362 family)/Pyruvate/2-oxoacid:ferredoxin oxidoreductase delta subunit